MIWRAAYAVVLWVALPLVLTRLWWRSLREPGYRAAVLERFGRYGASAAARDPHRRLIWLHAVSLGETRAAQPLFAKLKERLPDCDFLFTHMTATGREAAQELFGGKATLAWLPYDYPFAVRSFIARFRPSLGILLETEVWFNLVRECRQADVPTLLANARLSEKSARGYRAVAPLSREAFGALSAVAAQSDADARRLQELGAHNVSVAGNLKFDVEVAPAIETLALEFRSGYGGRKVFLAASTREGEEELILDALAAEPVPGMLVVIVPRHPQRFGEVENLLSRRGLSFTRRSAGTRVPASCHFVLGDSLGEMQAYYAAADVAYVGGSLLAYGGQNLIEACAAGVPVLFGTHTYNFDQAAEAALAEGAARRVADASALIREVKALLSDNAERGAMGEAGKAFCARHRGATDRIAALAERMLGSG
jgi:3-deoxy-D-manno-octulosonic-acid transferase